MKKLVLLFSLIFSFFIIDDDVFAEDIVNLYDESGIFNFSHNYNLKNADSSLIFSNQQLGIFSDNNVTSGLFDLYPELIESHDLPIKVIDNSYDNYVPYTNVNTLNVSFVNSINLNGFFIKRGNVINNNLYMKFYDGKNNLISTKYFDENFVDDELFVSLSVRNVKKIVIGFVTTTPFRLAELDFFVDPSTFYSSVVGLDLKSVTYNAASFIWNNPKDGNLVGNNIYLDDKLLNNNSSKFISYNLKNLKPETEYKLTVGAVYVDEVEVLKDFYFKTLESLGDLDPPKDVTELNLISGINSVELNFKASISDDVDYYEIYRNNELIISGLNNLHFLDENLVEDAIYIYKVVAVDLVGNRSIGVIKSIRTLPNKDLIPPADVTNLIVVEDYTQTNMRMSTFGIKQINALVTYDFPSDDDFSHVEILRNDKLLNNSVNSNRYMDLNIGEKQTYKYTIKTVDTNGNKSNGENVYLNTTFIPDTIEPAAPTGLNVSRNNSGGKLSWLKNNETDLDGYNVYVNGTKYNSELVKNLSQVLKSLENGTTYQLTVTAVDWSGNESAHSDAIALVPDKNASIDVNLSENYNLKDVADGTANWFASLWWIVAFVVGIALTFILGRRIKELFVGS